MFQNLWRNCEFFTLSFTINREVHLEMDSFERETLLWASSIVTLTAYEYVSDIKLWCLTVFIWSATWNIISVFGFLWNLLYYANCKQRHFKLHLLKVLVHSRNSSSNKSSVIKRTFLWFSTTRNPIVTNWCQKWDSLKS